MPEEKIYRRGEVEITTRRAMFGERSYAIKGITSVRSDFIRVGSILPTILIPSVLTFTMFCFSFVGRSFAPSSMMLLFYLLSLGTGFLAYFSRPSKFAVLIRTVAREETAFTSDDERDVFEIVDAINEAIAD